MLIRDRVNSELCPFGIVSIRDGVHSGLCPFGIVSIRDCAHLGLCPFGIVSTRDCATRDCVHLGLCPLGMVSIRDGVYSWLYPFGIVFFGIVYRIRRTDRQTTLLFVDFKHNYLFACLVTRLPSSCGKKRDGIHNRVKLQCDATSGWDIPYRR